MFADTYLPLHECDTDCSDLWRCLQLLILTSVSQEEVGCTPKSFERLLRQFKGFYVGAS